MVDDITLLQHTRSEALTSPGRGGSVGEVGPHILGGGSNFDDAGLSHPYQRIEMSLNLKISLNATFQIYTIISETHKGGRCLAVDILRLE